MDWQKLQNDLRQLNKIDLYLVLFYVLWVYLRCPTLPKPVHFAVIASLSMFMFLPLFPHHLVSLPAVIGSGLCFALLIINGEKHAKKIFPSH